MKYAFLLHSLGCFLRYVFLIVCSAAFLGSVFCAPSALSGGAKVQQYHPGLRTLGIWDTTLDLRLDATVWYPSLRPAQEVRLGGRTVTVSRNGREVPGHYPLILISHDMASSRMTLHDLAEVLARKGFVVAAPTHAHDNMGDTSGIYRAALFRDRPLHLLLTLETLLVSPELSPIVDESRIGLLGVGSGSATVLQLLGARPDVTKLPDYCNDDSGFDPYCTSWAKRQYPRLEQEIKMLLAHLGPDGLTPHLDTLNKSKAPKPPRQPASATIATHKNEEAKPENMPFPLPHPVRVFPAKTPARPSTVRAIKAVALLTPGLVALFQKEDLRSLPVSMAIVSAENDEIFPSVSNASRLRGQLPPDTQWLSIPDASHYSVQSLCPQSFMESFPAMCGKNTPEEASVRQARTTFLTGFFQKALGGPLPRLEHTETSPLQQSGKQSAPRPIPKND